MNARIIKRGILPVLLISLSLLIGANWTSRSVANANSSQRLLNDHSPNWRKATADQCAGADKTRRPVLLVTGWGGSERNSLDEDEQLDYFINYFTARQYREGCNLFYAAGTSPYKTLDDNGRIMLDNLCSYYWNVKHLNPEWSGSFDIIGYSYGGLRARHFVENDDIYDGSRGARCDDGATVFIENLITLGTPHGGEPFVNELDWKEALPLPFAGLIGLCAGIPWLCDPKSEGAPQIIALAEMAQPTRLIQNLLNKQPENTCYYLLAGDARGQMGNVPWLLRQVMERWPEVMEDANDFAVHRESSYVLGSGLLTRNYPRVNKIDTVDVHGYVPEAQWWSGEHSLISFVEPAMTFNSVIWPLIGKPCDDSRTEAVADVDIDLKSVVSNLQTVVTTAPMPLTDIALGVLNPDEPTTGRFTITEGGDVHLTLYWGAGAGEFSLIDPAGTIITPTVDLPNVNYVELDTGFGIMADYHILDAPTGTWGYRAVVRDVEQPVAYRLLYLPEQAVSISVTSPQWMAFGEPMSLSAAVTQDGTPLVGGAVSARIARPDASQEVLTLYDDGAHEDGATSDGIFANVYLNTNLGGYYGVLVTASGSLEGTPYQRTASKSVAVTPAAELTNAYDDAPTDSDSDGFYKWLAFDAGVNVEETGVYQLKAELWTGNRLITDAETTMTIDQSGLHTIRILFDGNDVRQSGLDGPYSIRNLMFVDQTQAAILIDVVDEVHQTNSYDHRQFGTVFKGFVPAVYQGH